jgi:hypothetical protein
MVPALSAKEKLQIQFHKSLRRGHTKNAELDPPLSVGVAAIMEPEETAIVRVDSTKGQHYWFTDRRLLSEHDDGTCELVHYQSVIEAHWMFKDFWTKRVKSLQSLEAAAQFKFDHFDRLEIESYDRVVVLEGLDQAYFPILHFFWWITRAPHDRGFRGGRDESGSPPTPER